MDEKSKVLKYLKENETDNINMINFIENYPINRIQRVGDSVVVKGTSDRDWIYISSKSHQELEVINAGLGKDDNCFAVIENWMIPILTRNKNIKWILSTMRLILPDNINTGGTAINTCNLAVEDSTTIYESSDYKEYLSIDYIKERIAKGISSCIRIGNEPVAWSITQDDGAIGFLHVLPEYRRMGFGRNITLDMIHKVRSAGKIPFVHIEEDNEKSMGLALSLGFQKDRTVNWLEII